MNFYNRFVGDIQAKTGHLSCTEMGVYDRLLDHYYGTESSLPGDIEAVCRIARAMSKDERKAVASVLAQFFTLDAGQFVQHRAEQEIAKAQPKLAAARANGARGGRRKTTQQLTQSEPTGLADRTQSEPTGLALQNQSSSLRSEQPPSGVSGVVRGARRCPPDFVVSTEAFEAMAAETPGLNLKYQTALFRDWEFAKARTDWMAAWRTWMRKAFDSLLAHTSETAYQRSMRERAAEAHPAIARAAPGKTNPHPMEILDGLARIAG